MDRKIEIDSVSGGGFVGWDDSIIGRERMRLERG